MKIFPLQNASLVRLCLLASGSLLWLLESQVSDILHFLKPFKSLKFGK